MSGGLWDAPASSSSSSSSPKLRVVSVLRTGPAFHAVGLVSLSCRTSSSSSSSSAASPLRPAAAEAPTAIVQGEGGRMLAYYSCASSGGGGSARMAPMPPSACPPVQCPWMQAVPLPCTASDSSDSASAAPSARNHLLLASAPPVVGLSASGGLYWGQDLVAAEVTSFAVRAGGAGGPALLYTTRKSLLYTVFFGQLLAGSYQHKELLASSAAAAAAATAGGGNDGDAQTSQAGPQDSHQWRQQPQFEPAQRLGGPGIQVRTTTGATRSHYHLKGRGGITESPSSNPSSNRQPQSQKPVLLSCYDVRRPF